MYQMLTVESMCWLGQVLEGDWPRYLPLGQVTVARALFVHDDWSGGDHGFFFGLFFFFWAAPMAYGGSQARGPNGVVAAGLHQTHSSTGSEPCL